MRIPTRIPEIQPATVGSRNRQAGKDRHLCVESGDPAGRVHRAAKSPDSAALQGETANSPPVVSLPSLAIAGTSLL